MSNRKSEDFKVFLNKKAKSARRAPVWLIAKAGENIRKYQSGYTHWSQTSLGNVYKGKKR